jgi:hypothetical protein
MGMVVMSKRELTRARVTLPMYGKRFSLFCELLVGRADCPFFLILTAALVPSAGIILDL